MSEQTTRWIMMGFVAVGFWLFAIGLSARLWWRALAQQHRANEQPEGKYFRGRSAYIVPQGHYWHCLNATLAATGIYLVPSFLFRFAHPPILIPWHAVKKMETKQRFYSSADFCLLTIEAAGQQVALDLPASARSWIEENVPSSALRIDRLAPDGSP
jgi:hypothetical protein